jgi:hypothetical protein
MTAATSTARTGDGTAEHLAFEWMVPDGADERESAREVVDALFTVSEGWIEVLGLELRLACYDRETLGEVDVDPPRPHHLLVRDPRAADVSIESTYRTIESKLPAIGRESVVAFVEQVLPQACGDAIRHMTGVADLVVRASRIPLPRDWAGSDVLPLDCYAGTIVIPVEHRAGQDWVAAPPARYLLHQPVALSVMNAVGCYRLAIDVYWSPWVGEIVRPGSPLAEGIARLERRGWFRTSE